MLFNSKNSIKRLRNKIGDLFVKFYSLIPLALREVQVVRYHPILQQCSYFFACFHATYKKHQHSSKYTFNGPLNYGHLCILYLCFQARQKMSFNKSRCCIFRPAFGCCALQTLVYKLVCFLLSSLK